MKNIQLSSPDFDRMVFKPLAYLACFGIPAVSVLYILWADQWPAFVLFYPDIFMMIGLGGFVWGMFHLCEPVRYYRNWCAVKVFGIPMVWLALVLMMALWFQHLAAADIDDLKSMYEWLEKL